MSTIYIYNIFTDIIYNIHIYVYFTIGNIILPIYYILIIIYVHK